MQFRDQGIINPRHPGSIIKGDRNAEPFNAHINGNPTKNSDPTRFLSHKVGVKAVPGKVVDVNTSKRINSASNPVLRESPNFVDLWLSAAHTADKLKSVIGPATRAGGLTDNSDRLTSRHGIAEVSADRVSETKIHSDYIKNSEFETMNVFEFEYNLGSRINPDSRINSPIQISSPIRPTFNILLTRPTENIPLT